MWRTVRRTMFHAVLSAVLLTPVALLTGTSAASAATRTVSVIPSTGLTDGETISVTVTGAAQSYQTVDICSADLLDHLDDPNGYGAVLTYCSVDEGTVVQGDLTVGQPYTVDIIARSTLTTFASTPPHCGEEPADCIVVEWDGEGYPLDDIAYAPIDLTATNNLAVTPASGLPPTATVAASGAHFQPGLVQLQECTRAWALAPDAATADQACGAATAATVADDGTFSTDVEVSDPVVTRAGASESCGPDGCALVVSSASAPVIVERPLSFGVPTLDVGQRDGLADYQDVPVTVRNVDAYRVILVGLCPAPDANGVDCGSPTKVEVGPDHSATVSIDVGHGLGLTGDGVQVDCRVATCVLVAYDLTKEPVADPVPVTFGPRPAVALSPSTGLLEGAAMAFHAENLPSNQAFNLERCLTNNCATPVAVTSSSTGTIDTTLTASDRLGSTALCHGQCSVHLYAGAGWGSLDPKAGYTMATGSVTATPSTGLTPGQDVVVAGTDLMPTYAGRTLFFPTGGWAVSICEKAAGAQPNLVELFVHCAVAPGGANVDVPGSTSSTTVQVPGTITKTLGGATDCTASADACVIGLSRWEQDGTVTSYFTPISFAGST